MTSREALTKLNVLSSYDTAKEKRDEYKECIYAIQKDLDLLEKYEAALEAIGEFVRPSILIFKDHYFWENNANDISLNYELPPEKGILLMELFGSRMTLIP